VGPRYLLRMKLLALSLALAGTFFTGCASHAPRNETPMVTMNKVVPCLWFQQDAEAAAKRYCELVPGSRIVSVARYGPGMPMPEGTEMLVQLELGGTQLTFLNGGPQFKLSEATSLFVRCEDQAEIDRLWSALGAGGREMACGWLEDRWGVSWQIVPRKLDEWMAGPPDKAGRTMMALLGMVKLDLAALQKAYDG
jgi:predicted 3-demethylubiquinone-9 3-methyltransferase (glyoxalase superfamily)